MTSASATYDRLRKRAPNRRARLAAPAIPPGPDGSCTRVLCSAGNPAALPGRYVCEACAEEVERRGEVLAASRRSNALARRRAAAERREGEAA